MSDTTPHRAMRRTIFRAIAPAFALLCLLGASPAALAQNLVANPGFENNPPPNFGNNIGWPISPWQLGPGQTSNVVKVDGPGGYNYGNSGPQSDADPAHAAGQQRHYLDIASGDNDVFQTFVVPSCGSTPGQQREVGFSGWFSTRDNLSGNGSISIRQGAGVTGPILKQVSVSLPAPASSGTAPWVQASGTVMVAAGSTITFDVFITDNLNFDQASMTFNATTCASSQLTLRKTWVNAKVNDTATVTATRNGTQIDSLASVANSINETDTDATAVTVFQGEAITLAEAMGTGNGYAYASALACTGGGTLSGNVLTVGSSGNPIVCTYTNSTGNADLSIAKTNGASSVVSGTTTTYTLTVRNNGPAAANGAVVRDTPGTGLGTCTVGGCSASGGAICPANPGDVLADGASVPTMPSGGQLQFQVACGVN